MVRVIATLAALLIVLEFSTEITGVPDDDGPPADQFVADETVEEIADNGTANTFSAFASQLMDQLDTNLAQRQSKIEESNEDEDTASTALPRSSTPEEGTELLSMNEKSTSTSSISTTELPPKEGAEHPQNFTSTPKANVRARWPPKTNKSTNWWLLRSLAWLLPIGYILLLLGLWWILRRYRNYLRRRFLLSLGLPYDSPHVEEVVVYRRTSESGSPPCAASPAPAVRRATTDRRITQPRGA